MKTTLLGLAAAGALLVSLPAIAQQPPAPAATPATAPAKIAIPKGIFLRGQVQGQFMARDRLIGAKVHNRTGQIIGDIEDLIVAPNNEIVGVVMGTGGFLGAGEKKVGVRLAALRFTQKDGRTVVTLPEATKEVLGALEPYKRAEPRKSLIERAKEKAQELTDKTKETSKDAAATAKEKAAPYIEKAKDATGQAIEKAKEAVTPSEKK